MNNEDKILQMLGALIEKVGGIETELTEFRNETNERFDRIETDVTELKQDVNTIGTQQRENTDIIKAVRHNQEHICAEIDALKTHTASAEALAEVKTEIVDTNVGVNELNKRLFAQEKEIGKLKLVK